MENDESSIVSIVNRVWVTFRQKETETTGSTRVIEPLIDIRSVYRRSGHSIRRTVLILTTFLSCYEEFLTQLDQEASIHNIQELVRNAHSLKGLLLDIGSRPLSERAEALEQYLQRTGEYPMEEPASLTNEVRIVARFAKEVVEALKTVPE